MNCPRCDEPVESGADFCGNCGQLVHKSITTKGVGAMAAPLQRSGETQATLALLFGIAGIIGALFMALIGLLFGLLGIVMGTLSRSSSQRGLSTAGLVLSSLAIVASLGVWTFAVKQQQTKTSTVPLKGSETLTVSADLSTPCYSASLVDKLNVRQQTGSCNTSAFNGQSIDTSTNVYKVYGNTTQIARASEFGTVAKQAIEKDIATNLPGFTVDQSQASWFAGSPAYVINVSDKSSGVAVVEAAVLHETSTGHNVFVLVHATSGTAANLDILESGWQWK